MGAIGHQSHLTVVRLPEEESTPKAQPGMDSQESSPCLAPASGSIRRGESTPSTSPGSASQRLENLRRHQPDDKLEKLKERIRRQRQHLEEAAEREKLLGFLEQPIVAAVGSNNASTSNMPTAKIRKVAAAPPAPIYKGTISEGCFPNCYHCCFFDLRLNKELNICEVIVWCFGNTLLTIYQETWCYCSNLQSFYSQVSIVLRQRSGPLMGKSGKRRSFITSAEKYTATCHDNLLVRPRPIYFHSCFVLDLYFCLVSGSDSWALVFSQLDWEKSIWMGCSNRFHI